MRLSSKTKEELRKSGIIAVYFFGSRALGLNHLHSDYDLGLVFDEDVLRDKQDYLKKKGEIYSILVDDLPKSERDAELDISFLQTASPALGMAAIRDGKVVFEADARARADFEEGLMRRYFDYLSLKREYEEANMGAFS